MKVGLSVLSFAAVALLVANGLQSPAAPESNGAQLPPAHPVAGIMALSAVQCTLPVRTDAGPGLLSFPALSFSSAGLTAAQARSYSAASRSWLPAEPSAVSSDRSLVAVLDSTKGGKSTLHLQTPGGEVIFARNYVSSVVGWVAGSLYITTIDTDQLLKVSDDGRSVTTVSTPGYAGDTWYYASSDALWGLALNPTSKNGALALVKFDVATGSVAVWQTLQPGADGMAQGTILGMTPEGTPILADLSGTALPAVEIVDGPSSAQSIYVSGSQADQSLFRPLHAVSDSHGIWLSTVDGALYWSPGAGLGLLQKVALPGGIHIYAFGGSCS